ncbi:hypothetical protein BDR26DRAFT_855359, partial [Obelidium mucronatum]
PFMNHPLFSVVYTLKLSSGFVDSTPNTPLPSRITPFVYPKTTTTSVRTSKGAAFNTNVQTTATSIVGVNPMVSPPSLTKF